MNGDREQPASAPGTPRTFSAALACVLELPRRVADDDQARAAMSAQLERLPGGWQDKLGILLNLGRNAQSSVSEGIGGTPLDMLALCDQHTRSQQYLERALAMLCAQRLDLERAGSPDEAAGEASVFERAWSRFGRELAASEPSEWTWFGRNASGTDELEKLYVRRGNGAWWSFGVRLDRPLRSEVGAERKRTAKRGPSGRGAGLQSLATHPCAQRRALQRAMRSVRARMGIISSRSIPPA